MTKNMLLNMMLVMGQLAPTGTHASRHAVRTLLLPGSQQAVAMQILAAVFVWKRLQSAKQVRCSPMESCGNCSQTWQ